MVVKKRADHGFHVPVIPKGPRSDRRRSAFKKTVEDNQICAFELLAAVAGKLLLEHESSAASTNEKETVDQALYDLKAKKEGFQSDVEVLKTGVFDHQGKQEPVSEILIQEGHLEHAGNKSLHTQSILVSQEASVVSTCDGLENIETDLKLGISEGKGVSSKLVKQEEEHSHRFWESKGHTDSGFVKLIGEEIEEEGDEAVDMVHSYTSCLDSVLGSSQKKDKLGSCVKSASLAQSNKFSSSKGYPPDASPFKNRIVKLGSRDDDENIFRWSQRNAKVKAYRPIPRRRVKKFLSYKYKKVIPSWKDYNFPTAVRGFCPGGESRKTYCGRERFQSDSPDKKRKLFDQGSVLTSDRGITDESFCTMFEKSIKANVSSSAHLVSEAMVAGSSPKGHKRSFDRRNSHVRLRIKSLRVPEIYLEIPENATVGSLKKKVLEAVTAMIDGGLHVGVRARGKKISDDSKTLLQTGCLHKGNVETLAFELEPTSTEVPLPVCLDNAPILLSNKLEHQVTRSPATPSAGLLVSDIIPDPSPQSTVDNHAESGHSLYLAASKPVTDCRMDSRAIVPFPGMNAEALDVVPIDQRARRGDLAQRRARRPFSVAEVEALVHSVEKLGTGRWRDVKLCAFDSANHRTYVDLKDKWKTLVHTAQIAPQQRRGQPVPQELLDRVLAAHAYWSQCQAKQIDKHQDAAHPIAAEAQVQQQ